MIEIVASRVFCGRFFRSSNGAEAFFFGKSLFFEICILVSITSDIHHPPRQYLSSSHTQVGGSQSKRNRGADQDTANVQVSEHMCLEQMLDSRGPGGNLILTSRDSRNQLHRSPEVLSGLCRCHSKKEGVQGRSMHECSYVPSSIAKLMPDGLCISCHSMHSNVVWTLQENVKGTGMWGWAVCVASSEWPARGHVGKLASAQLVPVCCIAASVVCLRNTILRCRRLGVFVSSYADDCFLGSEVRWHDKDNAKFT
jgi:hypothetical protein